MSDKYYVAGCRDKGNNTELCEDADAQFWTLYERDSNGLSSALIDCCSRLDAEVVKGILTERDALEGKLRALAADNAVLRDACGGDGKYIDCADCTHSQYIEAPETPVTDAILREVGARAVEGFAEFCGEENSVFVEAKAYYRSLPDAAAEFADRIRAGEVPNV